MECLSAIQWDHPAIVGPVTAAVTAGVFAIVTAIMMRKKSSDDGARGVSATVSPEITVAPQIDIDNKPSNVFKPTVKVGLNEKDVGQAVSKAVDPVRRDLASVSAGIKALSEQMATAQLAPKQPVPDSGDPLKVKAVEFYNAGVDAYDEGEIGQALGHWLDAVKLDPNDAAAHNNLGGALYNKGEFDAAMEHLNAALRIDPDDAITHYNFGVAMQAKGELDAAIEHYNAALRIDPDSAKAHSNLSVALAAKGELDRAIEHCNAARRIDPDLTGAHFNLGCFLARKKAAVAAVAALSKAIALDPKCRDDAKSDTDYDPIRDDPAFRKLVYGE